MLLECLHGAVRGLTFDGHKQSAGGLRIEEQVLIFRRDGGRERSAVRNKRALILQSAREMPFTRRLYSAGKILESGVIDLKGYRRHASRLIAQCHFPRVSQQAEAGY